MTITTTIEHVKTWELSTELPDDMPQERREQALDSMQAEVRYWVKRLAAGVDADGFPRL